MNPPSQALLEQTRAQTHHDCVLCGLAKPVDLHLDFRVESGGWIVAHLAGSPALAGYRLTTHGGVVAAVLDAAMTNCLFAHGRIALTAELNVRFKHPVSATGDAWVRAHLERSLHSLHLLRAELVQDTVVKAIATAKFMERVRPIPDEACRSPEAAL